MKNIFKILFVTFFTSIILTWCWDQDNNLQETKTNSWNTENLVQDLFLEQELHVLNSAWDDIYWVAYIPQDWKETHPLVIMSHGLWWTADNMKQYCTTMAQKWYVTYCYDFRWGWEWSRSSWVTTEMSPLTEVEDLKTVLNAALNWDFVDTENIYLMWLSQWWLVTALTAPDVANDIKWIITFYPAFTAKDMVHENYESLDEVPDSQWFNWLTLGKKYWEDMWDYDAYAQAWKYTWRVLLIQWDADNIVDISYAEQYKDVLENVEYHVIEWAWHTFVDTDEHFNLAIWYMEEFLNK